MSVIEKFSDISTTITKLIDFVSNDESVKPDFEDYMKSISAQNLTPSQIQAMLIPYIFERRLDEKSIIELYLNKNNLSSSDKELINALSESFSSIFEIKKVLSNGFLLYNLINEKTYTVLSLVKMTNYRGVYSGQYAFCRIFEFQDEYYVLEISNILSPSQKEEVQKFAIAKIIEKPEDVYKDNSQKLSEIETQVENFYNKFIECFEKDEIITTNQYADNIINLFNNYCESDEEFNKEEISENIKEVEKYQFFNVPEFNNSYSNFVEKSLGGFSSHKSEYDVGIVYDRELGLFAIPFYATFCKIFTSDDYKNIPNYKECVKSFLENDKIPHSIIKKAAEKSDKFINVINEILESSYTLDELFNHYKNDSVKQKIFSPTSVLYSSKIFADVMGFVIEETETPQKETYANIGRNDPCPCGSGKKYKKCCMPK